MLVVSISRMLSGDHHDIVLTQISTVIDVSLSQDYKLLIFDSNLSLQPSIVVLELSSMLLNVCEVVVK